MKATGLLVFCLAVYTASGLPLNEILGPKVYTRFIEVQDVDGVTHNVDLEASPNMKVVEEVSRNPTSNSYNLFTRQNPNTEQTLVFNDPTTINESNFNPQRQTVVIVHGWLINQVLTMTPSLRDAFLDTGDVNVIVVDWRFVALQDFVTASAATPTAGRALGDFLTFLNAVTDVPFETIHLVGFNLGAHLVGNAGRALNGKIARITGLDPSGPLWTANPLRLSNEDAAYVECIHTDGGVSGLGIGLPLGNVDFFPNGGISQPGCLTSYCEHNRAWQLFGATVRYNHLIGNLCTNAAQVTLNTCRGSRLHMGNTNLSKSASGMFRVNTGRFYPF